MTAEEKLKKVRCFLLDMDGTLYLEDGLIGDMKATLSAVRDSGRKIVYLTNNSSKSADVYKEKLMRLGIFDARDDIYTSGMATARYLNLHYPKKPVFLVGTDALAAEFEKNGVRISEDADIAVLGYDTTLTYEKLCKIDEKLRRGATFIATHPDTVCPAKNGSVPDIGSFLALLKASSGREPDVICGKPYAAMGEAISDHLGYLPEELLMAGDRLYTDIRFAINSGFFSLLVYSGETTKEDYEKSGMTVDLALGTLNEVVRYL